MRQFKELINNKIFMILFILFFAMPVCVLFFLVLSFKHKKNDVITSINNEIKEDNIIVSSNDEIKKEDFFSFVFNKNKSTWFKSLILIIFLSIGYYFALHISCEGLGCLASGILLVPFILSFIAVGIVLIVRLISSITEFYHPNQKKFHIPGWIIIIIVIILFIFNYAKPFVNKYLKHSDQINQNFQIDSQINSQVNNVALIDFVKGTFRIKDTNETFNYIEKYVPNIVGAPDYDQNAVSNCISWQNNQCKKIYFIENSSDQKRLAIYNEKSDAVFGKITDKLFFSEGKLVSQLPNPHKIDDLISYTINYKFNGKGYSFQRTENLCKNNNGEILCHDPSFKINDEVVTFHITGMNTNNLYGIYPVGKIIETELINYQEFKNGETYPIVNVN